MISIKTLIEAPQPNPLPKETAALIERGNRFADDLNFDDIRLDMGKEDVRLRKLAWGIGAVITTGALVTGLKIAYLTGAFDRPVKPTIPDINKHQTSSTVIPPKALVKQR